jgi:hypothetical protein
VPGEFAFGYGSLVAEGQVPPTRAFHPQGFVADLLDHRRCWGVAMDNRVDLPAYKYYLDGVGDRPDVFVAFLDIRPARGQVVTGVCLPVGSDELIELDGRERNYVRRDLTTHLRLPAPGLRVWGYVGSAAGRGRLTRGRRAGRAVIDRTYLDAVSAAYQRLAAVDHAAAAASLDPGDLPVLELSRHWLDV